MLNRVWLIVFATATACAEQRLDPHVPGDRCLQLCPDGMVCVGTTYTRARAHPGVCQLARNRCMVTEDCRPRERCIRPGRDPGVCHPDGLL
ncbi:MAG TPA: hypothetical protein VIQ54_28925 [Polyangia bacterium]